MLIVAFQMLSAVESQWLDFLVFQRAASRYATSSELAQFVSRFSVTAYGADIVFLLVVAGLLLRRFGLRYGLTANALGVLAVLAAILVATSIQGSSATIVFVFIVAARATDLTLSDGASRTSLSAAYQALPSRLRSVAQAAVEGTAVPVAIGASGVALLVIEAAGAADGVLLPVLTSLVVMAWAVVAILLYRQYRVNLLANLRGRTLDPTELTVEGESSLIAISRLVESADERDVRLGLDLLTIAEHPELPLRLERLVADERVNVRTDALERLSELAPQMAAAAARDGLDDPSAPVRAASIRVLGAAVVRRRPRSHRAVHRRRRGRSARGRHVRARPHRRRRDASHAPSRDRATGRLRRWQAERALAARMLGEYAPGEWVDRSHRPRPARRPRPRGRQRDAGRAAFSRRRRAAGSGRAPSRPSVDRRGGGGRDGQSGRCGPRDRRLGSAMPTRSASTLSTRWSGSLERSRVRRRLGVLRRHVQHPDREVGLAVMRAIAALGPNGTGLHAPAAGVDDGGDRSRRIDRVELRSSTTTCTHATYVLQALVAFADEPSANMQNAALRDELDLLRQRVLAALSMRHGTVGLNRVVFQLAQRDSRSHALALEWLDVTLTGPGSFGDRRSRARAVGSRPTQRCSSAGLPSRSGVSGNFCSISCTIAKNDGDGTGSRRAPYTPRREWPV